jgi:hypothetical protein
MPPAETSRIPNHQSRPSQNLPQITQSPITQSTNRSSVHLVIPTWNAAFVYDTPAGTYAALEIVEFANAFLGIMD